MRENAKCVLLSGAKRMVWFRGRTDRAFPSGPCVLKCTTVRFRLSKLQLLRFLAFFILLCFELDFGVNMKVLDKNIIFLMLLV